MTIHTVDLGALYSPQAAAYLARADRRVKTGVRYVLELLGLELPPIARRSMPGPAPARAVLVAFRADHPEPRPTTLAPRKPNAAPEAVADARQRRP